MRRVASRYSIGQRLALGLGFLFALQLAVVAAVFIWLHQNESIHDDFVTRIAPRAALAEQLEHTVFYVSIAARDQLLDPDAQHARAFQRAAERARGAVSALAVVPVAAERDARHAEMRALVERYVVQAELLVRRPAGRSLGELVALRETTLASIRDFVAEERIGARAALETMAENRRRVSATLAWLAGLSAVFFLAGGWLTVRSIRRPANRLLEFASALEKGNWHAAAALAPASPEESRHTRDELLKLGYAFGAAAVAIESREQQLQQQNEEIQAQNEEIHAQNEEIQAQNEEIQAQAAEIMAQNSELREQARALNEADERKNEFLGLLAHELRNPLAPMSNSLALLRRASGQADVTGAHAILERQLRHLVRLIDDLLDVTRISRGKVHVRRETLELGRLLRNCVSDLQASMEKKGLAIEVSVPREPVWVEGDDTRLSQVFGNLLGNAIKFTDSGGRIALGAVADARRGEARVRVHDNGRGMEAALLARLFTPFSQGDSELARTSGGLGLGLALVKGLVELHGGSVEARSDGPGRGSEFIVRLPLAAAPAIQAHASRADTAVAERKRRILLIEDNADAAHSLRTLLEADGHEVRVEHSGPAGVETARCFAPDMVLCDIGLPGMDGYKVARALRALPHEGPAPVLIALTGYATSADMHRTAEAGFDHHFAKPPDLSRLSRIVASLD